MNSQGARQKTPSLGGHRIFSVWSPERCGLAFAPQENLLPFAGGGAARPAAVCPFASMMERSRASKKAWPGGGRSRLQRRVRLLYCSLLAVVHVGCVAPSAEPEHAGSVPPGAYDSEERGGQSAARAPLPPELVDPWHGARRQTIVLRSQNLALDLPDGSAWQPLPRRGTVSGLGHQASGAELWVRHVPARRTVSVSECEQEARRSLSDLRDLPPADHEGPLRAPAGYGGTQRVYLLPSGGAQVVLFGVSVSRCLTVIVRMLPASGYLQRLQVILHETLPTLRVPVVDERGPRSLPQL